MKFCPKDGAFMRAGALGYVCSRCGYTENAKVKIVESAGGGAPEETTMKTIDKTEDAGASVVDEECTKCGNVGATWFMQQTRGGDEPTTRFYRCVKCGHTWREYA